MVCVTKRGNTQLTRRLLLSDRPNSYQILDYALTNAVFDPYLRLAASHSVSLPESKPANLSQANSNEANSNDLNTRAWITNDTLRIASIDPSPLQNSIPGLPGSIARFILGLQVGLAIVAQLSTSASKISP